MPDTLRPEVVAVLTDPALDDLVANVAVDALTARFLVARLSDQVICSLGDYESFLTELVTMAAVTRGSDPVRRLTSAGSILDVMKDASNVEYATAISAAAHAWADTEPESEDSGQAFADTVALLCAAWIADLRVAIATKKNNEQTQVPTYELDTAVVDETKIHEK